MSDHRRELLAFLQGANGALEGGSAVVGYAIVVELITPEGERGVAKITSDAIGNPAPWYESHKYAAALTGVGEYDESERVTE